MNLAKTIFRILTGNYVKIKTGVKKENEWYGSHYGGFFVCPNQITEQSIVYSFGTGEDITFDLDLIKRHNCSVYGFDPTPKSIDWISHQKITSKFIFNPYGVGVETGVVEFFMPKNDRHVSGSIVKNASIDPNLTIQIPVTSFIDITKELGHTKIEIVKMDIEGLEYEILPEILKSNVEINQILVEFHTVLVEKGRDKTLRAIKLLKESGYEVFATSENFSEVSFIKS